MSSVGAGCGVGMRRGGKVWTPNDLSTLPRLWWEADQGITENPAGSVEFWDNIGSAGGQVRQTTVSNRPTVTTLNGKPSVRFVTPPVTTSLNSFSPLVKSNYRFLHDGTGQTTVAVLNLVASADLRGFFCTTTAGSLTVGFAFMDGNNRLRFYLHNGTQTIASGPYGVLTPGTTHIVSFRYSESESPKWDIWVDEAQVGSGNTLAAPNTGDSTGLIRVGNISPASNGINGHLPLVCAVPAFLGTEEFAKLRAYARSRFG